MFNIKIFTFNSFQVNTYLLYDETGECAIIDAACYQPFEKEQLKSMIETMKLNPVLSLNTHTHIDHILGNNFVFETWGLKPIAHRDAVDFLKQAPDYGQTFGFEVDEQVLPDRFIKDEEIITFGNQSLKILYTPGHAAGSVCFSNEKEKVVIAGDVLFNHSIGRTDLPTGDFNLLINSIRNKLFILPDETRVYPGHGSHTTIGEEKENNPFL